MSDATTTADTTATTTVADTTATTTAATAATASSATMTASEAAAASTATTAVTATDSTKAPPANKWPDNWREEAAGTLSPTASDEEKKEHDKLVKRLQRYNSPADMAKTIREQDKLIPTLKKPLQKDATPEQVTEWRKENGIPETPDKYDLGLPDGTVLGDADKKIVDAWVQKVHGANASPEIVKAGTAAYLAIRDEMAIELAELNLDAKDNVAATLGAKWGADYKPNIAGVNSMLGQADSAVVEAIMGSRGPDGISLLNKPEVMEWLAGHARELGFVGATVVPSGGDLGATMEKELEGLKQQMNKDLDAWRKDTKAQARYQELTNALNRRAAQK